MCYYDNNIHVHSHLNTLVPDAPQVNLIPVYSDETQALTNLMIEIRSQMVKISVYMKISDINLSFSLVPAPESLSISQLLMSHFKFACNIKNWEIGRAWGRRCLSLCFTIAQDPFSIYEGISGSVVSYTVRNSSGTIKTTPVDCIDNACGYTDEILPSLVCQSSSGDSTVSVMVSATNRLGSGPASQPITFGQC
jgi:hypothetical protein